ncbi:integrase core domain-containing protein [Spirosoma endophyticum]|uniref:integrase core domain-containing protein n=1 Tax=Spirosoma endophyticum TaxID=662367 RepID=UPI000B83D53A
MERFNGTFRREVLDAHVFTSIKQVRQIVNQWLTEYNTERPHQSLKFMTPVKYRQAA